MPLLKRFSLQDFFLKGEIRFDVILAIQRIVLFCRSRSGGEANNARSYLN